MTGLSTGLGAPTGVTLACFQSLFKVIQTDCGTLIHSLEALAQYCCIMSYCILPIKCKSFIWQACAQMYGLFYFEAANIPATQRR